MLYFEKFNQYEIFTQLQSYLFDSMSVKFSNSHFTLSIVIYNSIEQINLYRLYTVMSDLTMWPKAICYHSNYILKN
jgi:hypothetical protein